MIEIFNWRVSNFIDEFWTNDKIQEAITAYGEWNDEKLRAAITPELVRLLNKYVE